MYRVVRRRSHSDIVIVNENDLAIKHGHELNANGIGDKSSDVLVWPDTEIGRVRAVMYKNLLNAKER